MDIHEHEDTLSKELDIHVRVSAAERHYARFHIERAVYDRITHDLVVAMRPEFERQVFQRIDWARITRAVEDAIIKRQADLFSYTETRKP